jgi:hypothetical protein
LEYLRCDNNQLISLNVSGCTKLERLDCDKNQLTSLNVSNFKWLYALNCYENLLTNLTVSGCVKLEWLGCNNNQLSTLDISGTILGEMECWENHLPLSELYALSEHLKANAPASPWVALGSQTLPSRSVVINTELFADEAILGSGITQYEILKGGNPAPASDYTVTYGKLTFHTLGDYTVTMSNVAIISDPMYPAEVTVEIKVKESLNNNASLASLTVSEGVLTPAFSSTVYHYTVNVAHSVSSLTIAATPADPNAHITGDIGTRPLNVGDNLFTITVTAEDGVTTQNYTVTVNRAPLGIFENETANVRVYPNPTSGELHITISDYSISDYSISDIVIFNMMGQIQKIDYRKSEIGQSEIDINIAHLPNGVYLLRITTEQGIVAKKVIKQ